jgi:5-methyltetrahydrofolate--homocysteine methyltransferase
MMADFDEIIDALVEREQTRLSELVETKLAQGIPAGDILNKGLIAGMDIVGEKMESEELFIPEVMKAAKIMGAMVGRLKPLLTDENTGASGKVVIGTVKGDLHDIGKNLVVMMLQSAGFKVFDVGVDVSPDKFIDALIANDADLLGLSALLTTTTEMMKQTVSAVAGNGLRNRVKIMIGGAPVTGEFSEEIGADAYAPDAGSAVRVAKSLLS